MLGIIAASDKTPLTIGTGNKEMHPLLISLANIDAGVRMKATSHAFVLAAYLPIPKFVHPSSQVRSALEQRVFHIALNFVFDTLKTTERHGKRMTDPSGIVRFCHTPLVSYIADLPEQRLLSCVMQNQSPRTTATLEQFGNHYVPGTERPLRTAAHTMDLIAKACMQADPADLPAFVTACRPLGLSGVHQPFWSNWDHAEPCMFLTTDVLHGFHKFFYDHVVKWVINIIGGDELDARLKALQPRVGVRHWKHGVSKLKQLTGREHRDLEKILVAAAAGGVSPHVLRVIRAIVDFIFQAQSLLLYDEHFHALAEALREFHHYKVTVINAGGRRGKKDRIPHFNIPKLEMMQSVAANARMMGAPFQYTTDITERCHITHVKVPYRMSNHRNFHGQCCRYMDRLEKVCD